MSTEEDKALVRAKRNDMFKELNKKIYRNKKQEPKVTYNRKQDRIKIIYEYSNKD